jgi:hypothetical protein
MSRAHLFGMKTTKLILGVALIGIAAPITTIGCKKSVETERKESAEATEEAREKFAKAHEKAVDERNDYLAAIRREQIDYRERIHDELDDIDRKLTDLRVDIGRDGIVRYDDKRTDATKVKELVDRRVLLRTDADVLDSSTEKDWETVKAKLEADLGAPKTRRGRI